MARLTSKLRSVNGGIMHWCQGCKAGHVIYTGPEGWTWNGDIERPTCAPSVKLSDPRQGTICHYFLVEGRLQFLNDCRHEFSGQTVSLQDIPDDYGGGE